MSSFVIYRINNLYTGLGTFNSNHTCLLGLNFVHSSFRNLRFLSCDAWSSPVGIYGSGGKLGIFGLGGADVLPVRLVLGFPLFLSSGLRK